ncbi:MAG: 4Fe-4S dicluster domain-containing protein [Planctomycetes bacterium]|nr:4Fe-4S dicluster domain-containing protein [Planctomycetota bacterium]
MAIVVKKSERDSEISHLIEEMSGVDLGVCFQCKKCTSGCPVAELVSSPPAEIMRRLHLGAGEELLDSEIVWMCLSCETCTGRCPMGVDIAKVMDALRALSIERGKAKQKGNMHLFNKAFLKTVQVFGRTYEMAMITAYKLGTGKFMGDVEKFPKMLMKGKISLLPSLKGDRKTVRRIFKKTKRAKGGAK